MSARCIVVASATALALLPAPAPGQSIGLYFDADRAQCTSGIVPFGTVRVYAIAHTPPTGLTTGALLSLVAPANIELLGMDPQGISFDTRYISDVSGRLTTGLNLQFLTCLPPDTVVTLFEFELFDRSEVMRSNLKLHLVGGAVDSTTNLLQPRFKICDPKDPTGNLGTLDAVAHDAWLNCTTTCICTTAVHAVPWWAIKSLYRSP
jgi:hypothetical protein